MNLRVFGGVERILRGQMLVAHLDAGRDARGLDCRIDRRAEDVVFVERYLSAEVGEAAFDREEQHLGAELHRRILRVNCPNSRGALRADCLWLHPDVSFIFFKSALAVALEIALEERSWDRGFSRGLRIFKDYPS